MEALLLFDLHCVENTPVRIDADKEVVFRGEVDEGFFGEGGIAHGGRVAMWQSAVDSDLHRRCHSASLRCRLAAARLPSVGCAGGIKDPSYHGAVLSMGSRLSQRETRPDVSARAIQPLFLPWVSPMQAHRVLHRHEAGGGRNQLRPRQPNPFCYLSSH
jgi:hypothetical protein